MYVFSLRLSWQPHGPRHTSHSVHLPLASDHRCTEAPTYSARSHNSIRSYASTKQIFYWDFKSITQDVNCGCLNNSIIYSPIQPIEKFCFLNKFSDSMSSGKHYFSISKYYLTLRHMFLVVLSFSSFTLATFS